MRPARLVSGALLPALGLLLAACVAAPGATPSGVVHASATPGSPVPASPTPLPVLAPEEFWAALVPGDPAAISYPSLDAIVRAADVTLVARLGELQRGPVFVDEYDMASYWGLLTLEVEDIVRGSAKMRSKGAVTVLVLLGVGRPGESFEDRYPQLAESKPAGRGVFFLSNMAAWVERFGGDPDSAEADPYLHEVLGGQGYLREVDGVVQPPLLTSDELDAMAGTWQEALRGADFDDVVAEIAALP